MASNERKYWCNSSMRFNLDSMINHVHCIMYGFEGNEDCKKYIGNGTVEIAGTILRNEEDCEYFLQELYDLNAKASGKVTGKEYGRIKSISEERQFIRYYTCLASGMNEHDAALAFTD